MSAPPEDEIIRGWASLEEHTGLSMHLIAREMGLYTFPKPVARIREGKKVTRIWSRAAVNTWLKKNWDLYKQLRRY
jgi:hypothetical protein